MNDMAHYGDLLRDIKSRIQKAQHSAILAVNSELICLYWDIGRVISQQQLTQGWGAAVIPRLAKDIQNELPEQKGFSERNLKFMVQLYNEYEGSIGKQAVSQLDKTKSLVIQIPWGHNIVLMQRLKNNDDRRWYMEQTIANGWSRDTLGSMLKSNAHERQGTLAHNFDTSLQLPQSELVRQALKDPYIFDFLTLTEPFQERELESELIKHLEKFLIELGAGFAFLGRQYKLTITDQDFYLDLLFYHIKLRCFIVVELKKGAFKPEYVGKMNFYCSAVDDSLRQAQDQATIGLILCETKNKVFAEYALRDFAKPIGISAYELTRALPESLKSSLPSIEELETELSKVD